MKTNLHHNWTLIQSLNSHEKKQLSEFFKSDLLKSKNYYFLFKTLTELNFFRQSTVKRLCSDAGIKNYSDLSKRFYNKLTNYFSQKDETQKDFSFINFLMDKKIYDIANQQIVLIIEKGLEKYPLEVALNILNLRRTALYHLNINTLESSEKLQENEALIEIYEHNFKVDNDLNKQLPHIWVDFYKIEISEDLPTKIEGFFKKISYDENWLPPVQLKYYWFHAMYNLCLKNYDLYIKNIIQLLTKGTHPNNNFLLILLIIAILLDKTLFNSKNKENLKFENYFKKSIDDYKIFKMKYTSFIKFIDITNINKKISLKQIDKYIKESHNVDVFVSTNKHDRIKDRFLLIRVKLLLRQGLFKECLDLIPNDLILFTAEVNNTKDAHNLRVVLFYTHFMLNDEFPLSKQLAKTIRALKKDKLTNNCYFSFYTVLSKAIKLFDKYGSSDVKKYKQEVSLLIEKHFGDLNKYSFPEEMLLNIRLSEILASIQERKVIIDLYK